MLISEPGVRFRNPILDIVASVAGRDIGVHELRAGVYEIGHFGGSNFLPGYEQYPEGLSVDCYGVCDDVEQLLAACPELVADPGRKFVVTVTRLRRENEPAEGGWRWRKWGPYIGTQGPQREYLHDEPAIEEILVYHVYERLT